MTTNSIGANIETGLIKTYMWFLDCFYKDTLTRSIKLIVLQCFAEGSQIWSLDLDSRHVVLIEQVTFQMVIWNPGCMSKYRGARAIKSGKEKIRRLTESQIQIFEEPWGRTHFCCSAPEDWAMTNGLVGVRPIVW